MSRILKLLLVTLIWAKLTLPAVILNSKLEIFSANTDLTINAFSLAAGSIVFSTNTSLYIFSSGTQATSVRDIANNKDISCYNQRCITANEYSGYPWTVDTNSMSNSDQYPLELQKVSRVLKMRVSIVEETNYFLMAAEGEFGINRFLIGNYDTHTKLEILGTADSDQISALLAYPGLTYGVAAYQDKNYLHGFDIALNLHVFNFDTDSAIGGFVAYTYDTSRSMLGIFTKQSYTIISLLTQLPYFKWDYSSVTSSGSKVLYASSPRQSMYTFLVLATQLVVFDHLKDESHPKIYSTTNTNSQVIGMLFSPETANLYFVYSSKIERYNLTMEYFGECHPNCFGCTQPLSQFYCKECVSGISISSTKCSTSVVQLSASYSSDNELTTKFGSAWIYVTITVCAMLVVGVLLYCVYQGVMQQILDEEADQKMKESEEEDEKKKLASTSNVGVGAVGPSQSSVPVTNRQAISQMPSARDAPDNTHTSMKDVSKLKQTWPKVESNL